MKIRSFGFLLVFLLAMSHPASLHAQEPEPPAEEASKESGEEAALDEAPPVTEEAAEEQAGEETSDANPESPETADEPDPSVQEAIEEADPAPAPAEGEADAAGAEPDAGEAEEAGNEGAVIVGEEVDVVVTEDAVARPADDSLGLPLELDGLPTEEGLDLPNPDDLLPEDVYVPEDEDLPPPPPVVTENEFDKERRLARRYQEVKLQALKDQAIRDMREKADVARTDEEKRQALREYYRMLFAKMVSIDPELEEKCRLMETAYMRRVAQFRVAPTIPLNPPPTPEPLPGRAESTPPASDSSDEG